LVSAFGVAGHEEDVRKVILDEGSFSDYRVDKIGNLICRNTYDDSAPSVLLDAHMDEVGFIVRYIDDAGMIYVNAVGGIDSRALIGKELLIRGEEDLVGIVANIPPHMSKDNKVPGVSELQVDTGLTKEELQDIVRIGTPIGYVPHMERLGGTAVSGKAFDNRVGCLALCELSKRLGDKRNVTYLFSTQEEVGTRGATVALKDISPDIAICVDATQGDMHFIDSPITRSLGSGAIIGTGPNIDPGVFRWLVNSARSSGVPYTTKAYPAPTPTNLRSMQLLAGGVVSGLVAIPCRYMHSPSEVVDVNDIISVISLLERFIDDVDDVIRGDF